MKRAEVTEALQRCVRGESNALWHGMRGLRSLGDGIEPRLVERAMRVVFPHALARVIRKLPDAYVTSAWRVIAKLKTPTATFLQAFEHGDAGERIRTGCAWLAQADMVDATPRNRRRIPELCANAAALVAAQATVVRHGAAAEQLLAIVAHDGGDLSIDALVDVVDHAVTTGDAGLDALATWVTPFARGARMKHVVDQLANAIAARGAMLPLLALAKGFGDTRDHMWLVLSIHSTQVRVTTARKAYVDVVLSSHSRPNASASITWNSPNFRTTRWQDGTVERDGLKLRGPKSVDDLPRWIAAAAKKLRVSWDPSTLRLTTTLRGKARAAAVAWLVGSADGSVE